MARKAGPSTASWPGNPGAIAPIARHGAGSLSCSSLLAAPVIGEKTAAGTGLGDAIK
ncbi:hypothetical protein ISP15_05470 [Dyella jejuensis]|uniref:Uncharacterized protein n=1 Tax=Dyella jejuensis TaxID=1432009 RepID=A0ABW8JFC2_9GAMM